MTNTKAPPKIPYAVADFAKLRNEGYYFVDKTRYIAELERYDIPVFLRPRRFGKSLLCSILRYYYDIKQSANFEKYFGGTWIGQHPTGRQNKYLVLQLNFSTITVGDNAAELAQNFGYIVAPYIRGLREVYPEYLSGLVFENKKNPADLLDNVFAYLNRNPDLPRLYIIIDEYDNFTNQLITASRDRVYEDVVTKDGFLKTFFKVIKEGSGSGALGGFYMTGVLPITIDDLTSGFNIAELVTLDPNLAGMLGFTKAETDEYLDAVFDSYNFDKNNLPEIKQIIRNNYDGYRFLPGAEPIYNSTILTYFLSNYTRQNGTVPEVLIDENLRTDINWIKRLSLGTERAKEWLDTLMHEGILGYDRTKLTGKFSKEQLFSPDYFPVSLFYLGMTTLVDGYRMRLPNLTMKSIFIDYYNTLNSLGGAVDKYIPIFETFEQDHQVSTLFEGYFRVYLGQFAAQSFDKMNENFVRNTFYELCSRYLGHSYILGMEQNYPSGRADWEITGRPGTAYHKNKQIAELKYFKGEDWPKIEQLSAPYDDDAAQVSRYAIDAQEMFPDFKIRKHVIYVAGNKGWKCWEISTAPQ